MDERARRLWAGTEAEALGWGGIAAVARATGLAISTVTFGRNQVRAGVRAADVVHVRRKGGGRRLHEVAYPELVPALEKLVDPVTRGDPESPLLATLVPPPRVHAVRYHGVFAPNSKVRRRIVPQPASPPVPEQPAPAAAPVSASRGETPRRDPDFKSARIYSVPWADLLKKVFAVDVLACPDCGGRLKLIAFIAEATVACRILDHLGLDSQGPPIARAQAPPERFDLGPDYGVADPSFTD